jgi:hypothetical protein
MGGRNFASCARGVYEAGFYKCAPQQEEDRIVAGGEAVEKPLANQMNYRAWATSVVQQELHKAGWRLADLLEKIL